MPILFVVFAIVIAVVGGVVFMRSTATEEVAIETPIIATSTDTSTTDSAQAPTLTEPASSNESATTTPVALTTPTPVPNEPVQPVASAPLNFTAKIDYASPAKIQESVTVSMTVENGVVTSVSNKYNDGAGENGYQKRFDGAYQSQVVGKKLQDISLSRVGGASLTSQAFNQAVAQFIAQS